MKQVSFLLILLLAGIAVQADWTVENFEIPNQLWRFSSFDDEDLEPTRFSYSTNYVDEGYYSLRLWGNTWKVENISDYNIVIQPDSIWQISIYTPTVGTIQSIGLTDGENTLRYIFECSDAPPSEDYWIPSYAGFKNSTGQFQTYKLSVGRDWYDRYNVTPPVQITGLIFINDEDTADGLAYFDQILDITDSEPHSPVVDAGEDQTCEVGQPVTFHAGIVDPDSTTFSTIWNFGDGSTAQGIDVQHIFQSPGAHRVLLCVTDTTARTDCDSLIVQVGPQREIIASLLFGGDCMFARRYEDADEDGIFGDDDGSIILPGDGGEGAFTIGDATRRIFADYTAVNLETPLSNQGTAHPTKSITFRSRPDSVAGLSQNGVDLVTLANNHVGDYQLAALSQTLMVLADPAAYSNYARDIAIPSVGGGLTQYAAERPITLCKDGLRMAFFGMNSVTGTSANEQPFLDANHDKYGALRLDSYNLQRCAAEAEQMSDLQVALLHSGIEYSPDPTNFIIEQATLAIDRGVDIVIASHPHIVQAVKYEDGAFIAYSMGNFIFDQQYAITMDSYLFKTHVSRSGFLGAEMVPVFIEGYIPKFQTGYVGETILAKLMDVSADYGTLLIPIGDQAVLVTDPSLVAFQSEPINLDLSLTYSSSISLYTSEVIRIPSGSFLKSINNLTNPPPQYSLIFGQDLLKFGTFEDLDIDLDEHEGTGWILNDGWSEIISQYQPFEGIRCLRLRREDNHSTAAQVESAQRMEINRSGLYCVCGYIRLVDARNATLKVKWQVYPYGSSSYLDIEQVVWGPQSGNQEWTYFQTFVAAPSYLDYASIIMTLSPPTGGADYSYAYFDDLRFIEWESVTNPVFPYQLADTNGVRYLGLTGNALRYPTLSYSLQTAESEDQDLDGIYDFCEDLNGNSVVDAGESDPLNSDSDSDGLSDWEEWNFGLDGHLTALHLPDSDGDLFTDAQELEAGTSPNDDESVPPWPTPTFSPTLSPTPTPSVTATWTASPTWSPTRTFTDTPTVTPSSTNSPYQTRTPTPSPYNPSITPTVTPTINPDTAIEINLIISDTIVSSGEPFWLLMSLLNSGISKTVDLYVALEVFGDYFFFPSWRNLEAGYDFRTMFVPYQDNEILPIIEEFTMPEVDPAGPFTFYAVMFDSGSLDPAFITSNLSFIEFRLDN